MSNVDTIIALSREASYAKMAAVGRDMAMGREYVTSGRYMDDATTVGAMYVQIEKMKAALTADERAELERREKGETLA